jgi:multiple sugar transport system permease protein
MAVRKTGQLGFADFAVAETGAGQTPLDGIAALSVLVFKFIWNDYFWATVMSQSASVRPVTAGISELKRQWKAAWELIAAASILAALPPVTIFFLMQRHLIAGLNLGATKG